MSSFLACWSLSMMSSDNWVAAIASGLVLPWYTHGRDLPLGNKTFKSAYPQMQGQEAKIPQCIIKGGGNQNLSHFSPLVTRPCILLIGGKASYSCHSEWQLKLSRNYLQAGTTPMCSKGPLLL